MHSDQTKKCTNPAKEPNSKKSGVLIVIQICNVTENFKKI